MCGRFKAGFEFREIKLRWKLQSDLFDFHARYNIAPTQEHPVIVARRGVLEARPMRWGLVPYWTTTAAGGSKMINVRSETTAEKPAFEDLLSSKRCLVPADGFYEWRKLGKERMPMLIQIKNRELFGFAGLWDIWRKPDGALLGKLHDSHLPAQRAHARHPRPNAGDHPAQRRIALARSRRQIPSCCAAPRALPVRIDGSLPRFIPGEFRCQRRQGMR